MAPLAVRAAPSWNTGVGQDSDIALVVTVNLITGEPLTGLQEADFQVHETAGTVGPEQSRPIAPFAAFGEHPPGGATGTYVIGVGGGGRWGGSVAIFIVDVEAGDDRGRTVTSVRF